MESCFLVIDYVEFEPSTYKGVVISQVVKYGDVKQVKEIIRVNSGDVENDEELALLVFDRIESEDIPAELVYLSSYDDYFQDLEYQNDPEYRADVDSVYAEMIKNNE